MTISVPVDLLRRELRLLIPLLSSLGSQFRTGWLSNAQFPEDLVAQTLSANVRLDALHPLQSIGNARMALMHLLVICPYSGQFVAFLRIRNSPIKSSANVLGARGTLLLVLAHFFEHGRWGSPVQTGGEERRLNAEDQLFIFMQAAQYLSHTRGSARNVLRDTL